MYTFFGEILFFTYRIHFFCEIRLLSKKNDEGLENDPIMKHPCDPDNSQLILSYDPIGLIQSLRNDMFRREEFPLEFAKVSNSLYFFCKNQLFVFKLFLKNLFTFFRTMRIQGQFLGFYWLLSRITKRKLSMKLVKL